MLDNLRRYRKMRGGLWRKVFVKTWNATYWTRNEPLRNYEMIIEQEDYRYFDAESDADYINSRIKSSGVDTNLVSDGYHTFGELYEHRITLWITLCKTKAFQEIHNLRVWRSKLHSDGTSFSGWFVLGIGTIEGTQMTYHLPIAYWDFCDFAQTKEKSPEFDGHTSKDVLERIKNL